MKKFMIINLLVAVVLSVITTVFSFQPVLANGFEACDQATGAAKQSAICKNKEEEGDAKLQSTAKNIINTILMITGALAIVMIILSGIYFVISGGNADRVKTAKSVLTYAIVGLIVSILSFAIVNFVINSSLAIDKTETENKSNNRGVK